MGIRLGERSSPPVRVYREHVDGNMVALIAYSEAVHHGGYYRASTFVLVPMDVWLKSLRYCYQMQEYGERQLRHDCGDYLEFVCAARYVQL